MMAWTNENKHKAALMGWELIEFWNQEKERIELQVFKTEIPNKFTTDRDARKFVDVCAEGNDLLSVEAKKLIFQSVMGMKTPDKTRKKK